MPALQGSLLAQTAKTLFKAKGITLPTEFSGLPPQAPFTADDQKTPDPGALFVSASTLKYHVDTASAISRHVSELIDVCSDAVGQGFAKWQAAAMFTGIIINGPLGMGPPGCLVGPPAMTGPALFALAGPRLAGRQPSFIRHVRSILFAIGSGFQAWQTGYTVTLTFPGGAVCSVTMPPSPNIPVPVASGASPGDAMMTKASLKGMMVANHGVLGNHTADIFDAVSESFANLFTTWKGSTMIANVIGAGGAAPPPPSPPGPVAGAIGMGGRLT